MDLQSVRDVCAALRSPAGEIDNLGKRASDPAENLPSLLLEGRTRTCAGATLAHEGQYNRALRRFQYCFRNGSEICLRAGAPAIPGLSPTHVSCYLQSCCRSRIGTIPDAPRIPFDLPHAGAVRWCSRHLVACMERAVGIEKMTAFRTGCRRARHRAEACAKVCRRWSYVAVPEKVNSGGWDNGGAAWPRLPECQDHPRSARQGRRSELRRFAPAAASTMLIASPSNPLREHRRAR